MEKIRPRDQRLRWGLIIFVALPMLLVLSATPVPAQEQVLAEDNAYSFSHDMAEQTFTFEGVNPYTKVAGLVTITINGGVFRGKKLGEFARGSKISGEQHGSFSFVPYDSSQPTFAGTIKFVVGGETTTDTITFDFLIEGTGSDGSSQSFLQREVATVNEYGAQISFGNLNRLTGETTESSQQ
jgi:hypothetical protein